MIDLGLRRVAQSVVGDGRVQYAERMTATRVLCVIRMGEDTVKPNTGFLSIPRI